MIVFGPCPECGKPVEGYMAPTGRDKRYSLLPCNHDVDEVPLITPSEEA